MKLTVKSILILVAFLIIFINFVDGSTSLKNWTLAKPLSSYEGDAYQPQISINRNGDAIVVWAQQDGYSERFKICGSYYTKNNWKQLKEVKTLLTDGINIADLPKVAINDMGNAALVFTQSHKEDDLSYGQINVFSAFLSGKEWSPLKKISSNMTWDGVFSPAIAIDPKGDAFAVWMQTTTPNKHIFSNHYAKGKWEKSELISDINVKDSYNPQIAINSKGDAFVVWDQLDKDVYKVFVNSSSGGRFQTPKTISNNTTGHAYDQQLAIDKNGNVFVVWTQWKDNFYKIYTSTCSLGNWTPPKEISSNSLGSAYSPQIAVNSSGDFVVVWMQWEGDYYRIYARTFFENSWQKEEIISNNKLGNAYIPKVVIDNNNNVIVVWKVLDGSLYKVYANNYSSGKWGEEKLISNNTLGNIDQPQIVMDEKGDAIVVWTQSDGSYYRIYSAQYK